MKNQQLLFDVPKDRPSREQVITEFKRQHRILTHDNRDFSDPGRWLAVVTPPGQRLHRMDGRRVLPPPRRDGLFRLRQIRGRRHPRCLQETRHRVWPMNRRTIRTRKGIASILLAEHQGMDVVDDGNGRLVVQRIGDDGKPVELGSVSKLMMAQNPEAARLAIKRIKFSADR